MDIPQEQQDRSSIFVRFIDLLFAVVLGQSFVLLSSSNGVASWLAAPSENIVPLANVVLAYAIVITSWVGYHDSTSKLPMRNVTRFIVDIALLFSYYLAFVNVRSLTNILAIFCVVFVLYFLWTIVRYYEYHDKVSELGLGKRSIQAGVFAFAFFLIAIARGAYPNPTLDGIFLAVSFGLLVAYRALYWGGPKKKTLLTPL